MTNNVGYCPNGALTNISTMCDDSDLYKTTDAEGLSIYTSCDDEGKICYPGCPSAIEPVLSHPCMKSDAVESFKGIFAYVDYRFAQMLVSCDEGPVSVAGDDEISDEICPESTGNVLFAETGLMLGLVILVKLSSF